MAAGSVLRVPGRPSECNDYRLLSSVQMRGAKGDCINAIVTRITDHLAEPIALVDIAAELGMSESRYFKPSTGNNFTDFVNRVRINNACHLLMQTEQFGTDICY